MKRFLIILAACGRPPGLAGDVSDAPSVDSPMHDGMLRDSALSIDAEVDAVPDSFTLETHRLGLNDVSFLVRLPVDPTTTATLATMTGFANNADLVPRAVFAMTTGQGMVISAAYEQFHIVAVRFDLCDRVAAGPCDVGADGQIRLSFQPLTATDPTKASDVALHASYRIPTASMPYVVNELRALARLQNLDTTSPLQVNPTLVAGSTSEYATRLAALVSGYARASTLQRLTVLIQPANLAPFQWQASGLEKASDGTFQFFSIPTQPVGQQWMIESINALYAGGQPPTYNVTLAEDIPVGFVTALDNQLFTTGTVMAREQALESLATVLNPTLTTSKTVQCADCHLATYLDTLRTGQAGVSPGSIPGAYSSTHDLSIAAGVSATDNLSVRAFGWRDDQVEISQRVANDSAMVVDEIETRFPVR